MVSITKRDNIGIVEDVSTKKTIIFSGLQIRRAIFDKDVGLVDIRCQRDSAGFFPEFPVGFELAGILCSHPSASGQARRIEAVGHSQGEGLLCCFDAWSVRRHIAVIIDAADEVVKIQISGVGRGCCRYKFTGTVSVSVYSVNTRRAICSKPIMWAKVANQGRVAGLARAVVELAHNTGPIIKSL